MNKGRRQFLQRAGALTLGAVAPLAAASEAAADGSKYRWRNVLTLDSQRRPVAGSAEALAAAIRRGADLHIYTEFRHNEHIDIKSTNPELIQEVAEFRATYLLEDRWVAGIMTLRQPIDLPNGFGPRPSMSFFMYNQDGLQAIARPYLDGQPATGKSGPSPMRDYKDLAKYHQFDAWDGDTNAPSSNFFYEFGAFRFFVRDDWQQVLAHGADGKILSGSVDALADAFANGCDVKVGVSGLCADLADEPRRALPHEIFIQCGAGYYYTEQKKFMAGSHPFTRVAPAIPLRYKSKGWDFGWLFARTDGFVARWLVDPYTLKFNRSHGPAAVRWFVR